MKVWLTLSAFAFAGLVWPMVYPARADSQAPQYLPPRLRNHCGFASLGWRPYCSNHCGAGYQFYYCSEVSSGCCHVGYGYCDFGGLLRCHP
jgi:hypothetical protein